MSESSVQQYLDSQAEAGSAEQQGSFTLSPEKAHQKLSEFQLENPGAYILKMIQAAVASEANEIDIKVSRRELKISFQTSSEEFQNPDSLLGNLLLTHSLPDSPTRHLAVGFNAAPSERLLELRWETPGGAAVLDEDGLRREESSSDTQQIVVRKKSGLIKWFRGTNYVDEIKLLTSKCGYSEHVIRLDGRVLRPDRWDGFAPFPTDDLRLRFGYEDEHINLLEVWSAVDGELYSPLSKENCFDQSLPYRVRNQDFFSGSRPMLLSMGGESSHHHLIAIRPSLDGSGHLGLVKDGILVEVKSLDMGHPGAVVLCQAESLRTDLSEFQFVENKEFIGLAEYLRTAVRSATEVVTEDSLQIVLQHAKCHEAHIEERTQLIRDWLTHHTAPAPKTLRGLLLACFPQEVHIEPDLPDHKVANVRELHKAYLPKNEPILAIFDDTIVGNAKCGFVVTGRRLCWKDLFRDGQYVIWENLLLEDLQMEGKEIRLMRTDFTLALGDATPERLLRFLRGIPGLKLKRRLKLSGRSREILGLALKHMGKQRGLHHHPHIPKSKLKAAADAYNLEWKSKEEPVLLLYDDTVFGGGDVGFALTSSKLYWRNSLDGPKSSELEKLGLADTVTTNRGIKFKKEDISIYRADLRQPTVDFFHSLAVSRTRDSDTGQPSN